MSLFFIAVAALYGLVVGSFVNAVAYRVPKGESLNTRSHCPRCDAKITAWQNIPLLSYALLRGKCASCGLPISWRYPAVELSGAVFFGVVAWAMGDSLDLATGPLTLAIVGLLYLAGASMALTIIDWEHQLLPTRIVYPTLAVVAATLGGASLWSGDYSQLLRAGLGALALCFFYGLLWAAKPGAMGFGDVRLALVVGFTTAWLSWGTLLFSSFAAFFLAAIFGTVLVLRRKAEGKTAVPFGPWMLAGMWIGLLVGAPLIDMYLSLGGRS